MVGDSKTGARPENRSGARRQLDVSGDQPARERGIGKSGWSAHAQVQYTSCTGHRRKPARCCGGRQHPRPAGRPPAGRDRHDRAARPHRPAPGPTLAASRTPVNPPGPRPKAMRASSPQPHRPPGRAGVQQREDVLGMSGPGPRVAPQQPGTPTTQRPSPKQTSMAISSARSFTSAPRPHGRGACRARNSDTSSRDCAGASPAMPPATSGRRAGS